MAILISKQNPWDIFQTKAAPIQKTPAGIAPGAGVGTTAAKIAAGAGVGFLFANLLGGGQQQTQSTQIPIDTKIKGEQEQKTTVDSRQISRTITIAPTITKTYTNIQAGGSVDYQTSQQAGATTTPSQTTSVQPSQTQPIINVISPETAQSQQATSDNSGLIILAIAAAAIAFILKR